MWLLARTDPDAPKRRGISAFIVDMAAPGITVQPIRQVTGEKREEQSFGEQFNGVFLDGVFVPEENRIGAENDGWRIARSTLVRERATNVAGFFRDTETTLRALQSFAADPGIGALYDGDVAWLEDQYVQHRMTLAGIEHLFDSAVRAMLSGTGGASGDTSVAKLLASELQQRVNELALATAGPYGLIDAGPEAFKDGRAARGYLRSRATTIGGGTSEIQRNWVAQHILGLDTRE
jgi:alkylation response protein AidB-like acyl-CoA dehydrogenase